jgi:hypothetical protein
LVAADGFFVVALAGLFVLALDVVGFFKVVVFSVVGCGPVDALASVGGGGSLVPAGGGEAVPAGGRWGGSEDKLFG